MNKLSAFGKNVSADQWNTRASFSPFAARTQQYMKEQLGQVEDKTQLPPDYIELEKRVDALKQVHQKMLQVTSQFANEAYDYPANIKESFGDLSRTVSEKVQLLSSATSTAEAQAALTAPSSFKPQPKTFNHAIARASLASTNERVGEARLAQDSQIQSRFLAAWSTTLNTTLNFASRARRNVENSRLMLDAAKAKAKNTGWLLPGQGPKPSSLQDDEITSEEARLEIEQAEDEFVGQTEEAVGVLDTPEPLRNLADLVTAQLEYHKKAYDILSELAPVIDALQVEQEVSHSNR
ncbi:hypothetical protein EPUL_002343, partial [Erysiphe pulchra]